VISNIEIYNAPLILTSPSIIREKSGDVNIIAADMETQVFYTLDGSVPTVKSSKYTGKINTDQGKAVVRAIAYNAAEAKSSPVTEERFDVSREKWKILDFNGQESYKVLDGNSNSAWFENKKMPADLVVI
jgi:alpha-L-fucosidase